MIYTVSWKIKDKYGGGTREIRTRDKEQAEEAFNYLHPFPEIKDISISSKWETVDLGGTGHAHLVNGMIGFHSWSVCDANPKNHLDGIEEFLYKEE